MFYLFKYLDYFIKTMIRSFVYKPKRFIKFLLFIIIFVLLFFFFSSSGVFAAEGNIYDVYNSINNDLVNRLDKTNRPNTSFYNYFNNLNYSFFVYYGRIDGSSMFTNIYDSSILNVCFYPSTFNFLNFENNVVWGGASCSQSRTPVSNEISFDVFSFDASGSYVQYGSTSLYLPTELLNYRSPVISEYLRNQKNVQEITNSITAGTDKINNSITDSTVSDDSMTIDTSNMNFEDSEGVDNFFTFLLNSIKDSFLSINDDVETIELPMPYTNSKITLRSDLISSHIKDTILETYINLFWYFLFGTALIMFSFRIINWFTSGKLAEEGVYSLADYLEFNNIIIKASMM